jgi:gamma-butyrobetaine dioxygenase
MTTELEIVQDWRVFATDYQLAQVALTAEEAVVTWSDGRQTPLHRWFLRDNCTCAACYLPLTREQLFEITDAPADLAIASAAIDAAGDLVVGWSDGHASRYAPGWLREAAPDAASRAERHTARDRPFIWGSEYADALKSFDYADIMADDSTLWAWLSALRSAGMTLVKNVPVAEESLLGPIARIAHLRETNFGRVFDVKSKPRADSAAYTSVNLPPHSDLPTRELQPGVQFLHCLVNDATGGESVFVDGFAIGEAMRREHPAEFATITTTPMAFWNRDDRTDYRWNAPAIALDNDGDLDEVRFANFLRGPIDAPADRMGAIYAALRLFQAMCRDPRYFIERRLAPGDMWAFDNRRVLHARREFDPQSGARHLQGAYVDRDEINSRWRVLSRQLGEPC